MRDFEICERLEIKEFLLDANLFLISNAFYIVVLLSSFLYYTLYLYFLQGTIETFIFIATSILFAIMLLFAGITYRSILTQKRYIRQLETIFEEE